MCEIRCNITDSSECGRDLYRSYVLCCIMYLFRCWRKSLRSPLACWMRMVRLHCTRHVWVIGLRMLKSCYNWASIIHPPSLIAFRSTVLLRRQVSGQLTTTCYCYCCCCEGNQNLDKVSHDLWPDNLENVISLSPYVNYNISICVGGSDIFSSSRAIELTTFPWSSLHGNDLWLTTILLLWFVSVVMAFTKYLFSLVYHVKYMEIRAMPEWLETMSEWMLLFSVTLALCCEKCNITHDELLICKCFAHFGNFYVNCYDQAALWRVQKECISAYFVLDFTTSLLLMLYVRLRCLGFCQFLNDKVHWWLVDWW